MHTDIYFLCFDFFVLELTNKCRYIGTMAPKGDSSKQKTKKKSAPKAKLHFSDEEEISD